MLCAPSLAGESFGMVLTEAFAAGTPVIASEIAGYSDVVTDGVDGILVPPADPQRLAEELQRLYLEPERRLRDGQGGPRERRSATPGRTSPREVEEVYEQALRAPEPATATERIVRVSRPGADRRRPAPPRRSACRPSTPRRPSAVQRHGVARKLGARRRRASSASA